MLKYAVNLSPPYQSFGPRAEGILDMINIYLQSLFILLLPLILSLKILMCFDSYSCAAEHVDVLCRYHRGLLLEKSLENSPGFVVELSTLLVQPDTHIQQPRIV